MYQQDSGAHRPTAFWLASLPLPTKVQGVCRLLTYYQGSLRPSDDPAGGAAATFIKYLWWPDKEAAASGCATRCHLDHAFELPLLRRPVSSVTPEIVKAHSDERSTRRSYLNTLRLCQRRLRAFSRVGSVQHTFHSLLGLRDSRKNLRKGEKRGPSWQEASTRLLDNSQ